MVWLQQHGCVMEKLDRKAIEKKLLNPELMPAVRRVLELRLGGAQAALAMMIACAERSAITVQAPAAGQAKEFNRTI
jgi:hypothetical protein